MYCTKTKVVTADKYKSRVYLKLDRLEAASEDGRSYRCSLLTISPSIHTSNKKWICIVMITATMPVITHEAMTALLAKAGTPVKGCAEPKPSINRQIICDSVELINCSTKIGWLVMLRLYVQTLLIFFLILPWCIQSKTFYAPSGLQYKEFN